MASVGCRARRAVVPAAFCAALVALVVVVGVLIRGMRSHSALSARLSELTESRSRALAADLVSRRGLEQDLHDGAQQQLVAVSLELGLLEPALPDDTGRDGVRRARNLVTESLLDLRSVGRRLYPAALWAYGLPIALEGVAARAEIPVRLELDLPGRLPEAVEVVAHDVVVAALHDVEQGTGVTRAIVRVRIVGSELVLDVVDDGIRGPDPTGWYGCAPQLPDRVHTLGGRIEARSEVADGDAVRRVRIPCG